MESRQRNEAEGYLRVAQAGLARPEKFSAETLFQLVALAIEGFWLAYLTEEGTVPSHHGFRDLIKAAEAVRPVPTDLANAVRSLDRYQSLCAWIPVDPRKPVREEIPGLIDTACKVASFTAGRYQPRLSEPKLTLPTEV